MKKEVPVLLLTGYLGSGKTTMVNHILTNQKGIKFAVIVNDIGEVNIDANLIQKGGVVNEGDDSLVALQNGCICCTLKMNLVEQIAGIIDTGKFDYIVIEASGICEPEPIARTICSIPQLQGNYTKNGVPRLDSVITVVDALRMQSEFDCGKSLQKENLDEDDIENLLIQQIEFCNIVVINKVSEVSMEELGRLREIVMNLQSDARIIECDYSRVPLEMLLDTHLFSYDSVSGSAGWVKALEASVDEAQEAEAHTHGHHDDDDDEDEHEHHHDEHEHEHHHHDEDEHKHEHHHHHHHDGEGDVEEYGIGTFVYYRRDPFDLNKFDHYVAKKWPRNVIRAKGICYFSNEPDMSYLFEQAGVQKQIKECGQWFATASREELINMMLQDPSIVRDWDDKYGDRMVKLVFIGQNMDKEGIIKDLDSCLDEF